MSARIKNYKCPSCSAPLRFDAASGRLKCDSCDSEFDPSYIESLYTGEDTANADASDEAAGSVNAEASSRIVADWESSGLKDDWGEDESKVSVFSCPSCGAQLILDQTTAATSCPYCGNNTIVPGQLSGSLKPDYIIPFKCTKDAAEDKLKEFYKGKFFLPRSFTEDSHIEEIKGIYVPFWLFDGTAHASIHAQCSNSRIIEQMDRTVTEVSHYDVSREGTVEFHKIPVDASSRMPDNYMDSLEPFNYDELKDFSASYLPGFVADKYDVEFKDCEQRVNTRCANTAVQSLASTISGYESVNVYSSDVDIKKGRVSYAMLPVWLLNSSWQGKNYKFAVNGQTGKVVGELPRDNVRMACTWGGLSVLLSAAAFIIYAWLNLYQYRIPVSRSLSEAASGSGGVALIIMMLLAGIITAALAAGMKNVGTGLKAGIYVSDEGLNLISHSDIFTHTTRSVTMKVTTNSYRGSGGPGMNRPGRRMR